MKSFGVQFMSLNMYLNLNGFFPLVHITKWVKIEMNLYVTQKIRKNSIEKNGSLHLWILSIEIEKKWDILCNYFQAYLMVAM